ncbi:FUN14 domain-containing protein [Methyloglobulus sp.]|uniref:FUN14 domain-containing protein n=1 Tax=Methyloglobulus sp. TaxID=2518622 RepID=UPI0032B78C80
MNETPLQTTPETDLFSADFLLGNVGAPFIIGAAVGFFAKKMLKFALFIGGAAIVMMFVGEYYNIINISDVQLQSAAETVAKGAKDSGSFLVDRLTRITSKGVSAAGGFFVGFKFG